jgi:hypothetical protein
MVAIAKFVVREAGLEEMLQSHEVRVELRRRAQNVLEAARSGAPSVSGDYVDSIAILDDTHTRTGVATRATVHVGATVPYAMRVESLHGTLARALDAARK